MKIKQNIDNDRAVVTVSKDLPYADEYPDIKEFLKVVYTGLDSINSKSIHSAYLQQHFPDSISTEDSIVFNLSYTSVNIPEIVFTGMNKDIAVRLAVSVNDIKGFASVLKTILTATHTQFLISFTGDLYSTDDIVKRIEGELYA